MQKARQTSEIKTLMRRSQAIGAASVNLASDHPHARRDGPQQA
jgi:hypothetical protein